MIKKLRPDGVPVSILSTSLRQTAPRISKRKPKRTEGRSVGSSGDDPTVLPGRSGPGSLFPQEPPTRPVTRPRPGGVRGYGQEGSEPRTVIAGGWRASRRGSEMVEQGRRGDFQSGMADPVVGWLVVVDGPGKGNPVRLGNGQNSIGRGKDSRVCLDFGDRQISRNDHAVLTYDPRSNRFYIRQGQGVNLVYIGEDPVLSPTPLLPGCRITLGETTLRFVAFCDGEFRWSDPAEPGG